MWVIDVAMASTGTPVDAILGNVKLLTTALVVTGGGVILSYKGLRHMADEGGGHLTGGSLAQLVPGVALAGGGFLLAIYLMGGGAGMPLEPSLMPAVSLVGDLISAVLNPVGMLPAMAASLAWRRRHG
jgi:hypothetical protein